MRKSLAIEVPFTEEEYAKLDGNALTESLAEEAMATFVRKKEKMAAGAMPYIKEFVEERGAKGPIGVPVTDGRRIFNIRCDIQEAYDNECAPLTKAWEKAVLLSSIDTAWQEQLREMDELRKSVQNASYEQKDPLVIYKLEAFELWKKMLWDMNSKAVATLMRGKLAVPDYEEAKKLAEEEKARQAASRQPENVDAEEIYRRQQERFRQQQENFRKQRERNAGLENSVSVASPYASYSTTRDTYPGESAQRQAAAQATTNRDEQTSQPTQAGPRIGRNDLCPCGSGKKYKNCHGKTE